jgi:hypothetical protein
VILAQAISNTRLTAPSRISNVGRTLPTFCSCKEIMRALCPPGRGYCCCKRAAIASKSVCACLQGDVWLEPHNYAKKCGLTYREHVNGGIERPIRYSLRGLSQIWHSLLLWCPGSQENTFGMLTPDSSRIKDTAGRSRQTTIMLLRLSV